MSPKHQNENTVLSRSEVDNAAAIENALRIVIAQRPLMRPKTGWREVLVSLLLNVVVCCVLAGCLKIAPLIPYRGMTVMVAVIILDSTLRVFFVKVVECYQHYAKEETRRRCLCIPSCSQYAIVVLKSRHLFGAIYRILKRLFKTCQGWNPKMDLP